MNLKKLIRKAQQAKTIRQVAALPFRVSAAGPEVMLVTSRGTGRFVIPKGWPMKGRSLRKAAFEEARQEAGVTGRVMERPVGTYRYWKRLSGVFVPVDVTVYLLDVYETMDVWRECAERRRAWLTPAEAASLIDEPELATLVARVSFH